ncbi:MAG TPA: ABC transporter permease, partial [Chitinophagaceae bacterium]|nr:ABC transporter permease [Chitinophagaceae bacterium]
MFLLLFKSLLRSKVVLSGLLVLLLAGGVSIYIGKKHLLRQQDNIARVAAQQRDHQVRNLKYFDKELGLLLYYLRFGHVNETHPLNGLSIGQRDVHPSVQNITIRGLEAQKYDTDLFNPSNLLAGNLDLGFVLLFLFPLVIIALTYNLLSEEQEGGTWKLVLVQADRPYRVLLQKLGMVALLVYGTWLLLLAWAAGVLSLPADERLGAVFVLSTLYLLVWLAVCFAVVLLQKRSSINALVLLGIWLLFTIVLPGAANSIVTTAVPVPEALSTT